MRAGKALVEQMGQIEPMGPVSPKRMQRLKGLLGVKVLMVDADAEADADG